MPAIVVAHHQFALPSMCVARLEVGLEVSRREASHALDSLHSSRGYPCVARHGNCVIVCHGPDLIRFGCNLMRSLAPWVGEMIQYNMVQPDVSLHVK